MKTLTGLRLDSRASAGPRRPLWCYVKGVILAVHQGDPLKPFICFFLFFAYKSTKVAGTSRDESFTLDRCVAARWGVYITVVSMQRVKICPCWWTFMGSFTGLLKWSTAPAHTFKHKVSWTQTNGIRRRRGKKTKNGRQQAALFAQLMSLRHDKTAASRVVVLVMCTLVTGGAERCS